MLPAESRHQRMILIHVAMLFPQRDRYNGCELSWIFLFLKLVAPSSACYHESMISTSTQSYSFQARSRKGRIGTSSHLDSIQWSRQDAHPLPLNRVRVADQIKIQSPSQGLPETLSFPSWARRSPRHRRAPRPNGIHSVGLVDASNHRSGSKPACTSMSCKPPQAGSLSCVARTLSHTIQFLGIC